MPNSLSLYWQWTAGVIEFVDEESQRCSVLYDDGERETDVAFRFVRAVRPEEERKMKMKKPPTLTARQRMVEEAREKLTDMGLDYSDKWMQLQVEL